MTQPNGTLLDSTPVELNTLSYRTVKRMYDIGVIEDTVVEKITYLSDGHRVKGYTARPKEPGVYPTIIWNRGGFGDRGALDDLTVHLILASTARWGYVLLATQYRGNKGGEGVEDWGGNDVHDAYALLKVAEQIPECDTARIAVEGASRGGMTTFRLLTMYDQFRCAIVHGGIADLPALYHARDYFRKMSSTHFPGLSEEQLLAKLRSLSGVQLAERFPRSIPILLMHGTADTRVPKELSIVMANRLEQLGHPHRLELIPGGGHVALKDDSYRAIDILRKEWLAKYLKHAK
jgi:dipeptidyl aminopeptidase/acylaminoacyl peptidase